MSNFFARIREWPRRGRRLRTSADSPLFDREKFAPQLDRKIHQDLNSLLEQENRNVIYAVPDDPFAAKAMHMPPPESPHIIPLTPSTRKRPYDTSVLMTVDSTENDNKKPDQSMSSSTASNVTGFNASGETFGPRRLAHRGPNKASKVPTTPASQDTQTNSQTTTPRSASDQSHSGRSRGNTVSSSNTFGIPSPKSIPVKRRKPSASITGLPPLPPLDHPAFKTATVNRGLSLVNRNVTGMSAFEPDEMGQSKITRHSHSLPSLSHLDIAPSDLSRKRTRTQSQRRRYEFFSEAKSSTPLSRRQTHKRSHSNVSQSSSRRASAEFSAEQASSASQKSGLGSSWEVQVSREMVRLALGQGLGSSEKCVGPLGAVPKSDQTRDIRYPAGTTTLGSPFLFQVAHTHHTPAAKHCGTTSGPLYQGTFERTSSHIAMSKNDSQTSSPAAQSHPPQRSRTPSPPSKLNTVAFTSSAVPSTSHLVPPSLSFTAATPVASPVSPILRSSAFITSTEPVSSVLRIPSTSSASTERPASSKGKRKADEAGVGAGGTPPKEAKEPRATFATVEPRRHRASANSNATSNAPSSYHRKRARLSAPQESRPGSRASNDNSSNQTKNQNAATTGSWSSKMSKNSGFVPPHHTPSLRPVPTSYHTPQRESSRRSISQASIPMSALISPHAPSISPSTTFHMRDPRKPAPIQSTSWSLSLPVGRAEPGEGWRGWIDRGGSPLHAWLFFVGFVLFPLWWIASCMRIPKTRTLDGQEKGVVMIDDPQVEHDAKSWRLRCRVMAVISFFTYIPFIVCVAVFA